MQANKVQVLMVGNNKGGVGKSTISAFLADYFANSKGKKVLLIDIDPQANLSSSFLNMQPTANGSGYEPPMLEGKISSVIDIMDGLETQIYPTSFEDLYIIPSHADLVEWDNKEYLMDNFSKFIFSDFIQSVFDLIIIDTPPAKGFLTRAALRCSDHVLIPFVPEHKSILGLGAMVSLVKTSAMLRGKPINIVGILPNRYDGRLNGFHQKTMADLKAVPILDELLTPIMVRNRSTWLGLDLQSASPNQPSQLKKSTAAYKEVKALGDFVNSKVFIENKTTESSEVVSEVTA